MKIIKVLLLGIAALLLLVIIGFNLWGYLTLGTLQPDPGAVRDPNANQVVLVSGATGSVGDGLLKAAMEDSEVKKIYVLSRRSSSRIDAGVASGKVELILHKDFTDYSDVTDELAQVNTVLWALGTTSVGMDDETYTWIHVDFPVAFVRQWLAARSTAPMSFHYVTGMGTDPAGSEHWAREKGRAELEVAAMAEGTGLRTFGHRSGYIRPPADRINAGHQLLELVLTPGSLVITGEDLGNAMLEMSARTGELANGTVIDNADAIAYAKAYRASGR